MVDTQTQQTAPSDLDIAEASRELAANVSLVYSFVEELWNRGNLAAVTELCHHTYELHDPSLPSWLVLGRAGLKQLASTMKTAFPNLHVTIDDQFAQGDQVVTRVTQTGTHTGDFMGLAATGRRICVAAVSIERVANGKIVESLGRIGPARSAAATRDSSGSRRLPSRRGPASKLSVGLVTGVVEGRRARLRRSRASHRTTIPRLAGLLRPSRA